MKVEKINNNYSGVYRDAAKKTRSFAAPSFQGAIGAPVQKVSTDVIVSTLKGMMGNGFKFMDFIKKQEGEVFNTIFNSVGTGLVAPIFIKWNPLSKTDKDTRTYSAWRQPLSAVLAIGTQAAAVVPFNTLISKWSNEGSLPQHLNTTLFQDAKYLTKQIKKLHPDWDKEAVKKAVDQAQKDQSAKLVEMIKNGKIEIPTKDGKPIIITEDDPIFKKATQDTLDKLIKKQDDEFKKCLEVKAPKKIERARFYKSHPAESKKLLTGLNKKLDELLTREKPGSASAARQYRKFLNREIKELRRNNANPELINLVKEVKGRLSGKSLGPVKGKLSGMIEDLNIYSKLGSDAEISKFIFDERIAPRQNAISRMLDVLNDIKAKTSSGEMTVAQADKYIKDKIQMIKSANQKSRLEEYVKDFAKQVADTYKEGVKRNRSGFKAQTGLIVALCMLPITCSLLNWIYPRFMDWAFPNLSNKKHNNVSKEMVEKANKNAEVKS